MTARPPSRKYRKRERREAARHGLTLNQYRDLKAERARGSSRRAAWQTNRADPAEAWSSWRKDVT